ncbi:MULTISPECIES: DUF6463 family protein [unclassified Pseudoalteromonas]|uniref:DUF6463 family protein n=1 Tax=unclassified Pseudoalteromonas TaxID=194690 RepID=UPI00110BF64F|nr:MULTISPECIES: DUF6463 family protein [unclassified Pseudoalteromonas]TMP41976.1 hypothetical protein CWB80_19865 [Pseudoalteromonas sp. S1650]TMP67841.1 hypothetical protein CWB79_07345 [Pseudoalteromonas sp. S1649]
MKLYGLSGWLLVGIGTVHIALGVVMGWPSLVEIVQAGVWNSIQPNGELMFSRSTILWFLLVGCFWWLLGGLMQAWLQTLSAPLPRWLGWGFVAAGLMVGILLPISGAWLFIPLGLLVVYGAPIVRQDT